MVHLREYNDELSSRADTNESNDSSTYVDTLIEKIRGLLKRDVGLNIHGMNTLVFHYVNRNYSLETYRSFQLKFIITAN
jgi:hypothetical protein